MDGYQMVKRLLPVFVFLTFAGIALAILGLDLRGYPFGSNDGPSLLCSYFGSQLLHPGTEKVLACTYDHQPVYFYFLKVLRWMTLDNINLLRHIHVLFWVACVLLVYLLARKRGNSFLASFVGCLYLLSSPFFLLQGLQIRMYILYLFFALVLFWFRDQTTIDRVKARAVVIIGYLTYLFIVVPVGIWDLMDVVAARGKNLLLKVKLNLLLIGLVAVKAYYVYFHRFVRRGSGDWYLKHDWFKHANELLIPVVGWPDFSLPFDDYAKAGLVAFGLVAVFFIVAFVKGEQRIKNHLLFCFTSWLLILFIRFVLRIDEVEYRYILYVTPILLFVGLEFLKNQSKLIKTIALVITLAGTGLNVYWMTHKYAPSPEVIKPYLSLRDLLQKYKPQELYTFEEYTITNYVMSYQTFLYGIHIPILEMDEYSAPYLIQGNTFALIDVFEGRGGHARIKIIEQKTGYKFESLGCVDFGHPKVCLFKIDAGHEFDKYTPEEIKRVLVPWEYP
jgi:hypothetical protein